MKKSIIWAIVIAVIVAAAIGGYYWYKNCKSEE